VSNYTDPEELFDVCDSLGRSLGYAKRRAEVHRDGDWHRSLHCWVVGQRDGGPFILFQRRSGGKDTWPNKLDATVGGHVAAGETLSSALRETEEEIGITVDPRVLVPLGVRVSVNDVEPGVRDCELQHVFLYRLDAPLSEFRPNAAEISALVAFPLAQAIDFFAGESATLSGKALLQPCDYPGEFWLGDLTVEPKDFIPITDRYFYRVCIQADLFFAGYRHLCI